MLIYHIFIGIASCVSYRNSKTQVTRYMYRYIKSNIKTIFYHGYCKDQRNAAVIILRYTMDYEKWYTSLLLTQCEEIRAFEIQNHANYMYISRFRCGVDLEYFVLACKKSNKLKNHEGATATAVLLVWRHRLTYFVLFFLEENDQLYFVIVVE